MGETEGKVSVTVLHESGMEIDSQLTIDSRRVQHCAEEVANKACNETDLGTCVASNGMEVSNDSEVRISNEQEKDVVLLENKEFGCSASCETKEVLNDIELQLSVEGNVKDVVTGSESQPCPDTHNGMEVSNDSEVRISNEQEKDVVLLENKEFDCSASCETKEVLNDIELQPSVEGNVKDVVTGSESQPCPDTHMNEVAKADELEASTKPHAKEVLGIKDPGAESRESEAVDEQCMERFAKEPPNDAQVEAKEVMNESKIEPFAENRAVDMLSNGNLELFSGSNEVKEAVNDFVLEQCPENKVKEASNDDIYSEVSNPNQSPKNATSSLTISSQLVDVVGNDHGGCGEITSACSPNSSVDGSPHEAEQNGNDKMESVSTSCVVLEIPKHVKKTGIRKITFKFSKCKEDYDDGQSVIKRMANDEFQEDYYDNQLDAAHPQPLTKNGFQNHEWNEMEDAEMNLSMNAGEFHDMQGPFSSIPNRELKMSKKIIPDNYPTNVKKLLSTRILEGARVKYISVSGRIQIPGIIRDGGYLCGCNACNFSKVVSAYEFELHAGSKTRHPNNHIYLENGRPIYSIIQELRTAPLNTLDEVIKAVAGSSVHEEYFQAWKASLLCGNDLTYVDSSPRKQDVMHYSTCSYPNRPTEGSHYPASWHYPEIGTLNQQPYVEVPVERKRMIKKPKHYSNSSVWEQKKTSEGGTKKRDNDLHKLLFMPNGLPDGTDLAYYSRGKRILGGYKQGNGIVCSCCNSEISPSQFEAHAGWAAKRQPYRHIYISSGLTLHDIALMLASGQSLVTGGSDDMCAVCGGVGELILCNGCPRAFHADCLGLQCLPADGWHCPYCRDKLGPGRKASGDLRPIVVRLTRVVKAPELEPGGCVFCRSQDFSAAKFDDRTVILCDQCEKEYHVGCLREAGMCDLKELPKDKWFCRDNCSKIFSVLQNFITSGPEEIPAPVLAAIRKKHVAVGLNEGSIDEIQWRILSGKSRFPEHLLLLSRAAAIFRECFDPIVAKSGRDLIPVMVYGRNISGQEFSGMYCVVLIVKSVVVSAALLRIFGQEVAELPLVATCREYQGKGYFQALFSCIERFLLSMNVKHLVLPAAEEAEAMWTKKLGFRKTSNEQMLKYTRDLQLTIFKGTSLLEKEVPQLED